MTSKRIGTLAVISRSVFVDHGHKLGFHPLDGAYIDRLASYFERVVLYAPIIRRGTGSYSVFQGYDYEMQARNLEVEGLPAGSVASGGLCEATFRLARVWCYLLKESRAWDFAYVFMPSPVGVAAATICLVSGVNYAAYLGAEWARFAQMHFRWRGVRGVVLHKPYVIAAGLLEQWVMRHARLRVVVGPKLFERYRSLAPTMETPPLLKLGKSDFYWRLDTCQRTPITCLTVASLHPRKGLSYLLKALALLRERGWRIVLEVVGSGESLFDLQRLAFQLNIDRHVRFSGYLSNGPSLFAMYRAADIFVLPTLGEGFPRVLYEAMAHGLPIVTTSVDSIPYLIRHGSEGLLVAPRCPEALASAVETIITDKELRQRLIRNGLAMAERVIGADPAKKAAAEIFSVLVNEHNLPKRGFAAATPDGHDGGAS